MNKFSSVLFTLLITSILLLGSWSDANAKRFGGARSFGSRSLYSTPYRRSTNTTRSMQQQQAYRKNQTARQSLSRRGGLMGLFGSLALGGLLGALFFGGAFEGINFMDILIFGGIAWLLYKLFAAKTRISRPSAYENYSSHTPYDTETSTQRSNARPQTSAQFDTDVLFNKHKKNQRPEQTFSQQNAADYTKDFDLENFLTGAKTAFRNLQTAWDKRDLAEIRGLTTDKVFAEIQQQLQASKDENHTEVLELSAELLDVKENGTELQASVLFDAMIRESITELAEPVKEVWHFIKPIRSIQPKWYLDGIQQLED